MTLHPTSQRRPRLPTLLAIAALCAWLATVAGIVTVARPVAATGSDSLPEVLPRLGSELQLPYFSFARALRPGS